MIYILCMDSDSDVNVHKGVITSSAAVSNESEDGIADDINVDDNYSHWSLLWSTLTQVQQKHLSEADQLKWHGQKHMSGFWKEQLWKKAIQEWYLEVNVRRRYFKCSRQSIPLEVE